ncbi:hypothetical protein LSA01_05820 [Latilactobacillus sakei]|nr:ubiquitin carboxyl-terminal hydrolase [Latilactobacillus sakei subsp. sakei DSM 20017 = JCM 1157]GEA76503.1 hypothetical protein LSA01_05820 [Latilactobacillus sakei]GEL35838.1 hypothetical protein LSA02_05730 [Latilactobacillus sakei subsp. sakei]
MGATGDKIAKANNGIVVKNPAIVPEIPILSLIKPVKGPTAVNGALKFVATNIIPRSNTVTSTLFSCTLSHMNPPKYAIIYYSI